MAAPPFCVVARERAPNIAVLAGKSGQFLGNLFARRFGSAGEGSDMSPQNTRAKLMSSDHKRIDFGGINRAALANVDVILRWWLPGGRVQGAEYVARNPRRNDRRPGSFKINMDTGRWGDFATGDRGGDLVSLAAYLAGLSQVEAARELADMLGVPFNE